MALGLVGCYRAYHRLFVLTPVPAHRGDGDFRDISWRSGPLAVRCYDISMPSFDLGGSQAAEYRVAALPDVWDDCGVYLAYRDPQLLSDRLRRQLGGRLELEVLDGRGRVVAQARGSLKDFICFETRDLHAFYQHPNSFFAPDGGERYTVRLSYTPAAELAGRRGFVYLRAGGK
jgi:hypothetical protein